MSIKQKQDKYRQLCHAMQTGVAYSMEKNPSDTTPKNLRVGVNSAMVENAALVNLLIAKGIITLDEFYDYLIKFMEQEVDIYQSELETLYGTKITLR